MPNYDFSSLSAYDFEDLVRDLLQEELQITLESFTAGRDKGIDLRCSTDPSNTVIVQCKHYAGSTFRKLFSKLRSEEAHKVKQLKPSRYILAISNGLTPFNKDGIKSLFGPYCLSTGDIYGRNDLNNLLGKFPYIETQHFKLWLTSKAVLQRVLNSNIFNSTQAEIESIKRRLKYYVQNLSFFKAKDILEQLHYCIIAGIPGIGKSTLAEILLIEYLTKGYEVVKISENIDEAYRILDPTRKQIFYYDDFLGQTSLENKLGKNEDQSILRFIEEVHYSKNSKFILTTREYILNQAKAIYERLARSDFDMSKCVIDLSDYTKAHRAKILFNHVYFSALPDDYKRALLMNRNYLRIINHPNFNPRVIELMIDFAKRGHASAKTFVSTFLANLENPAKIWEHIFENQLSFASQQLLLVLATLPKQVYYEDLRYAFESVYKIRSLRQGLYKGPQEFKKSLKELEGNFIRISR